MALAAAPSKKVQVSVPPTEIKLTANPATKELVEKLYLGKYSEAKNLKEVLEKDIVNAIRNSNLKELEVLCDYLLSLPKEKLPKEIKLSLLKSKSIQSEYLKVIKNPKEIGEILLATEYLLSLNLAETAGEDVVKQSLKAAAKFLNVNPDRLFFIVGGSSFQNVGHFVDKNKADERILPLKSANKHGSLKAGLLLLSWVLADMKRREINAKFFEEAFDVWNVLKHAALNCQRYKELSKDELHYYTLEKNVYLYDGQSELNTRIGVFCQIIKRIPDTFQAKRDDLATKFFQFFLVELKKTPDCMYELLKVAIENREGTEPAWIIKLAKGFLVKYYERNPGGNLDDLIEIADSNDDKEAQQAVSFLAKQADANNPIACLALAKLHSKRATKIRDGKKFEEKNSDEKNSEDLVNRHELAIISFLTQASLCSNADEREGIVGKFKEYFPLLAKEKAVTDSEKTAQKWLGKVSKEHEIKGIDCQLIRKSNQEVLKSAVKKNSEQHKFTIALSLQFILIIFSAANVKDKEKTYEQLPEYKTFMLLAGSKSELKEAVNFFHEKIKILLQRQWLQSVPDILFNILEEAQASGKKELLDCFVSDFYEILGLKKPFLSSTDILFKNLKLLSRREGAFILPSSSIPALVAPPLPSRPAPASFPLSPRLSLSGTPSLPAQVASKEPPPLPPRRPSAISPSPIVKNGGEVKASASPPEVKLPPGFQTRVPSGHPGYVTQVTPRRSVVEPKSVTSPAKVAAALAPAPAKKPESKSPSPAPVVAAPITRSPVPAAAPLSNGRPRSATVAVVPAVVAAKKPEPTPVAAAASKPSVPVVPAPNVRARGATVSGVVAKPVNASNSTTPRPLGVQALAQHFQQTSSLKA